MTLVEDFIAEILRESFERQSRTTVKDDEAIKSAARNIAQSGLLKVELGPQKSSPLTEWERRAARSRSQPWLGR